MCGLVQSVVHGVVSWSNLNGSKSVESWDALQQSRQHMDQIAQETIPHVSTSILDPQSQMHMHMRKSLTIMTSSQSMYHDLEGLKCRGQHQHQQVQGTCRVDGNNMLRTNFTENYPRKFARRLAKSLCKLRVPREKPYLLEEEQCLWSWTLAHGSDHGDRVTKRIRMSPQAKLKVSRARDVEQLPWGKRC